jgi:hypothetical protein
MNAMLTIFLNICQRKNIQRTCCLIIIIALGSIIRTLCLSQISHSISVIFYPLRACRYRKASGEQNTLCAHTVSVNIFRQHSSVSEIIALHIAVKN